MKGEVFSKTVILFIPRACSVHRLSRPGLHTRLIKILGFGLAVCVLKLFSRSMLSMVEYVTMAERKGNILLIETIIVMTVFKI